MKKIICAIIIALLSVNTGFLYAQPSKVVKNITNRIDSVKVSNIADSLNSILNDTIKFGSEVIQGSSTDAMDRADAGYFFANNIEETRAEMDIAKIAIISSFSFILLIIVVALAFGYMRRKAKYRLIEKAIENNYPLPEYLFNKKSEEQWGSLKSGIVFIAVGFGMMIAFNDLFMSGVFLIVLIIGVGKIITYVLNKKEENRINSRISTPPMPPFPPVAPSAKNNVEPDSSENPDNENVK